MRGGEPDPPPETQNRVDGSTARACWFCVKSFRPPCSCRVVLFGGTLVATDCDAMSPLPADRTDTPQRGQPRRWCAIGRWFAVAWLGVCLLSAAAMGQEGGPGSPVAADTPDHEAPVASADTTAAEPAAASPPQRLTGPIQYVGPDTYILLDERGRPQPVLGMSYEDFVAAWRESQHLDAAQSQPRYTIENLHIEGRARERRAELEVEVTVRLLADQPVAVPLRLAGAILRAQPEIVVPGDGGDASANANATPNDTTYLDYDPQRGGFVAGLRGRTGQQRTLKLSMFVPLVQSGTDTALELACPRALVSTLSLDVDSEVVDASASDGTTLTSAPLDAVGTRLAVSGPAGQFRLAWKTPGANRAELATVLSATGAILVSIDGRSVQTDAHLSVRSYGGSFDRFRVRLPAGAKLIQDRYAGTAAAGGTPPAYHITLEDESGAGAVPPGSPQVVLVQLPSKQLGPVEVDLSTEQPLGLVEAGQAVELAGFEVVGAVRQFGDVGLRVADDWQSRWELGRNVRQVEPDDLVPQLAQQPLTAAFQYDRQPWSLGVRVAARGYRIHVTPGYELDWMPDEARLRVHLVYQVLGARAFEFRVALGDWELTADPIESGGLVDRDRVQVTDDGLLLLPLLGASSRRAEVTFQLRQAIDRKQSRIELALPVPLADSAATGDLEVHTAAGIELAPDASRSTGLTPTPATGAAPPADDDGRPEFHYRCLAPGAIFAAERIVRPREVSIDSTARLDIGPDRVRVEQRLDCLVRYEPLQELVLNLPENWPTDAPIEAVLIAAAGGSAAGASPEVPLSLVAPSEDGSPPPADGNQARTLRVPLPQPRLGRFSIVLRYTAQRPAASARSGRWSIPLAQPVEGYLAGQRASVHVPRGWAADLDPAAGNSAWRPVDRPRLAPDGQTDDEFTATEPQLALPLVLESADLAAPSATAIERVWLQGWVSAGVVQFRAAYRFHSAAPVVAVELPPGVLPPDVEVLLDGALATLQSRDQGRLVVTMPTGADDEQNTPSGRATGGAHTLELRYRLPSVAGLAVRQRWTPPQLAGMSALGELYWHVVLPADMQLVRSPDQVVPAGRWQWLGGFWGRLPEPTQSEMEDWVGATSQLEPSAAQNQYLFSGLAPVASIEVLTMPRWLVVLAASGVVVALTMAWLYLPAARRGWLVLLLAMGTAALAVAFPTPAMLFGQAAVLGVAISAVAVVLARLLVYPVPWSRPSRGSTMVRLSATHPESYPTPVVGTTNTSPASLSRPVSDSQR